MSPFCGPSFNPGLLSVGFILEEEAMEEEFLSVFPVFSLNITRSGLSPASCNLTN